MSMEALKSLLRDRMPALDRALRQILVEVRVARHLRWADLVRSTFLRQDAWKTALPVQAVPTLSLDLPQAEGATDFRSVVECLVGRCESGQHTVYLAPAVLRTDPFRGIAERYPSDAALKVLRSPGGVRDAALLHGRGHSHLQRALLYTPEQQLLVANRLFSDGVGPRLYDLVELVAGGRRWTAFVVQHLDGVPTAAQSASCVERLKQFEAEGLLGVVVPGGFGHRDFQPPTYSGNIRCDTSGRPFYVDFQNFTLAEHGRYLEAAAAAAAADTHFGDKSLLRGGRYLYQDVPGLRRSGKRSVVARMEVLDGMLADGGVSVADRVVLDFGCNVGMMMAEYLRRGAHWCVGWDLEKVTGHTQTLLHAIGCTRFSVVGGLLGPETAADSEIPAFLRQRLDGCVISYLAVRAHFSWLPALERIPWEFMIYEGHEHESAEFTAREFEKLQAKIPVEVIVQKSYRDGDSRERPLALLRRVNR